MEKTPLPPEMRTALPGEREVDAQLLDQAVRRINHIYAAKGLELARAIGNYVVETFFAGDLDQFRARQRRQACHLSRPGQARGPAGRLHHHLVLGCSAGPAPLPSRGHRHGAPAVPSQAARSGEGRGAEAPSGRACRTTGLAGAGVLRRGEGRAEREQRRQAATGGPPLPDLVKRLTRLRKAVKALEGTSLSNDELSELSTDLLAELHRSLDEQIRCLQGLLDRLAELLGEKVTRPT